MKKLLLHCTVVFATVCFSPALLCAQLNNQILDDQVLTVKLSLNGEPLSLPIADINAPKDALMLQFDHLGEDLKDYAYTIVQCNRDWTPTELDPLEYINGFSEDRITNVQSSTHTLTSYTVYTLTLPNQNMRWTKSGNYLLKVIDKEDNDRLVLTRRFMVVEQASRVSANFVRTAMVDKSNTYHEIDFSVQPLNLRIGNFQYDVSAVIMQNGRWDNAIGPVKPYVQRSDALSFDYQDQIIFPAGKEFRFFDIRSFDYRGEHVKIITEKPNYYEVTLLTDKSRFEQPIDYRPDGDGHFVIENLNPNQTFLQCEYADVLFSIAQNQPLDDADVYVFGELSDWQLKPEFKMQYSQDARMYYCETFLKQGYYNYEYAVVDHNTGKMDPDGFEGNWYETENNYTILVYYHPFGARYDRLVGTVTLNNAK